MGQTEFLQERGHSERADFEFVFVCLQAKRLRYFAYQMIKGVTFCHRSNIIHRDIKPENLLINP